MGCVEISPAGGFEELDVTVGSKALLDALNHRDFEYGRELLRRSDAIRFVEFHESVLCEACQANAPMDLIRSIYDFCPQQLLYRKGLGFTPLHYACYANSPEEVRRFLLQTGPEAASIPSATDHIPLHAAIRTRKNTAFIKSLLHIFPEGILARALNGQTPLDLFFMKWKDKLEKIHKHHGGFATIDEDHKDYNRVIAAKDVLLLLVEAFVSIKFNECKKEKKKRFPLHETIRLQYAPPIFKQLIAELVPTTIFEQDDKGNSALHLEVKNAREDNSNQEFVHFICEQNPLSAKTPDKKGLYPIELAIENGESWETILILHLAAPDIISQQSDKTGKNLFLLATCSPKANITVVYELLKLDPSVVKEVGTVH